MTRWTEAAADVPFAAIYLRKPGTDEIALAATSPPGPAPVPLAGGPGDWPAGDVLRTGQPVTVSDVAERFPRLPPGGWETSPAQAMVLPLTGEPGGTTVGAMVLAASGGRALDEAYRSFLGLVAQQTAALVNGAIAYQVQQRRAEELAELDRAKTTFFSNISHEFRTPLALIMGPLEELRGRLGEADETARQELDVIHRNGLRLGKLVNTLLDFSRIEAGRMQARYEPVDLAAFTADLASVFRSSMERAGLTYQVDCPELPHPVYIDQEMWEKVILNLVSNALKFTFEGTISVTLRPDGDHAVLRVADTGVGVAPAEMPRLFERFHRIPNSRSRSNEGSGIGLALVRELVGLHGGTISAESHEGAGTVFTIRLPFGRDHLPPAHVAEAAAAGTVSAAADPFLAEALRWLPDSASGTGPQPVVGAPVAWPPTTPEWPGSGDRARVLLADDNADMREYLQRLLGVRYEVTAVADGLAALDAIRADAPDLVISDVMMPGLDGLALVAALRSDPRTADVPVLLLSARAGQEAAIEGLGAGADDYLVKPFSAAELLARVRANVELAQLRTHHARWRAALIDSLHEAFFLCDESGAVVEINAAFTGILGYGPEDLPYPAERIWWPQPDADPEAYREVTDAFGQLMGQDRGSFVAPVTHQDGHRLWVAASFNEANDPDTGRRMVVGTLRDITAERYAGQREQALAAMGLLLSRATSLPQALQGALNELRRLWHARRAIAVTWVGHDQPEVLSTDPETSWSDLPGSLREAMFTLRRQPLLTPADIGEQSVGITVEYPLGLLAVSIDPDPGRPFTAEDRALLALLCGYLGQALHRVYQSDQQRETALVLQRAILGPARLPDGFAARYEPAWPLEVGGDWFDIVELPDGRTGIVVGDCVGHGLDAATVMGQLRSACRALLLQDASAAQTLSAMDRFAALIPGAICSTVFCGILDAAAGRLTYSSAGSSTRHPGSPGRPDRAAQRGPVVPARRPAGHPADRSELRRAGPGHAAAVHRRPGRAPSPVDHHGHRPGRVGRAGRGCHHGGGPGQRADGHDGPGWWLRGRRGLRAVPAPGPAGAELRGRLGSARPGPRRAPGLAAALRPQPAHDPGRPGRGGRSLRQRRRARPPVYSRSADTAPRRGHRQPASPDRHRQRPVEGGGARRQPAPRPRHRADAGAHAAGHHRAGGHRHHRRHAARDHVMTTPLTLSTDRRPDGSQVLTADGEIDMSNAAQLGDALAQTGDGPVVVDLTSVGYLDSAGLTVLFTHADHIELIVTSLLAPVLTICGLSEITQVRDSEPQTQ